MKFSKTVLFIAVIVFFISCNSELTLQKYIVDSKENTAFMSVDLPASILKLKNETVSENVERTLKTIQKVNFLALQFTDSTKQLYKVEKEKVKSILENPIYKQLIKVHKGKMDMTINYLGTDSGVEEVVIFGSENSKGFAIIRVLGKNMNPADIMEIAKEIQLDKNAQGLGEIGDIIKNMY